MKHIIFCMAIFIFMLSACDRVENPIPYDIGNYDISLFPGNYATDYNYPTFGPNNNTNVNVLLEDYTGHQCGNCPDGAATAKGIADANPGRVIVISEHAGAGGISQYQRVHTPDEPEYPKYNRDFTNEAGLSYATSIPGLPGNPYGLVSRKPATGSSSLWITHGQWQQYVQDILAENNLRANLQMIANHYDETNSIFVHVETEAKSNLSGNYNLVIAVLAKEIIDWQKNYASFPADIEFYEHHNVHIGNVNGIWGEAVFQGETEASSKVRKDYTYVIPEKFSGFEYVLVAYLMNADTYEIIQVIEVNP